MLVILAIILGQKGFLSDSIRGLIVGIGIGFLLISIFNKNKGQRPN